jgi:hypothetical protein
MTLTELALSAAIAVSSAVSAQPATSTAIGDGPDPTGEASPSGVKVSGIMTRTQTRQLPQIVPAGRQSGSTGSAATPSPYTYQTMGVAFRCDRYPELSLEECDRLPITVCAARGEPGPLTSIQRLGEYDVLGDDVGLTCFPDDVPGGANNPQITLPMIRREMVRANFAKPELSMQPVGNKTLVTLPVFYKISWGASGFHPGEIRAGTLLGHDLRIKPTFKSNTYVYGDGASSGKTSSFGGVYPNGDITHPYDKKGSYKVHATTTYGGEFSLDGGPWMTIPGTVAINGPTQTLQVVTAKNRLVQ